MALLTDINDLLNKRKVESDRIEFKKGWNPKAIYRSISAFANDTAHLFIGVDSLAEAVQFFRQWIAPDVKISEDHGNLTCPLTDKDSNAQGTVYFRPTSSNGYIAEVTASADTRLATRLGPLQCCVSRSHWQRWLLNLIYLI